MSEEKEVVHKGGCHCGAVRWEVEAPTIIKAFDCNCSICYIKANLHFIVPKHKFRLIQGENSLTTYTFNTHTAKHLFCKICGVQSFYVPRSNPDGYGVNPRCIDDGTVSEVIARKCCEKNGKTSIANDASITSFSK